MKKAVITGDIILSTQMEDDDRKLLTKEIAQLLKELVSVYKIKSEMFRGDSFQCLVPKVKDAIIVALLIKTRIRSLNPSESYNLKKKASRQKAKAMLYTNWIFDARLAIGIGEVPKTIKELGTTLGEAFFLSGHLLDEMKNEKQALNIATIDKYSDELETEMLLLDNILAKTTALQCEVLHLKLWSFSEIQIAKKLGVGQSAVNQRSNAGSWPAIRAMVERFETIYKNE